MPQFYRLNNRLSKNDDDTSERTNWIIDRKQILESNDPLLLVHTNHMLRQLELSMNSIWIKSNGQFLVVHQLGWMLAQTQNHQYLHTTQRMNRYYIVFQRTYVALLQCLPYQILNYPKAAHS